MVHPSIRPSITTTITTTTKMVDSSTSPPTPHHTRRLVTVRRITAIEKDRKHNLEFARLDGWTVLVAPGLFRAGDDIVYFEIDSFLPKSDGRWWELIARDKSLSEGREGYRVKSRRCFGGGRVSQGLVFPLRDFPEIIEAWREAVDALGGDEEAGRRAVMGMAFEDLLGVNKYVAEMDYAPYASLGPPPGFIQQPAWERAQNVPDLFRKRGETVYQITEKLDGWSMSVYWVRHGSR